MRNISIKTMRKRAGMTQKELAEKIGVDQTAVTLWEKGKTNPRFGRLKDLAAALNCTVEDLMEGGDEEA